MSKLPRISFDRNYGDRILFETPEGDSFSGNDYRIVQRNGEVIIEYLLHGRFADYSQDVITWQEVLDSEERARVIRLAIETVFLRYLDRFATRLEDFVEAVKEGFNSNPLTRMLNRPYP